jgi:hypothetical protein
MANWRCPKCNAENRPEDANCRACQEPRPGKAETLSSRAASRAFRNSLRDQSRSLLDDLQSDLKSSLKESGLALDRLSAGLPRLSDINVGMPDLDRQGQRESPFASGASYVEKVTTRDLKLQVLALPRLNYALAHCGLPLIPSLEISNSSCEAAQDVLVKSWVATDYGEPWQKTIPEIPPRESHVEKNIIIPLRKSRLQEVQEAEKANLRVDIYTEGALQVSETFPMEVLAYNEWYYHPDISETMACFVQPNSEAIEKIISLVRDRLRKEYHDTSLDGYQSNNPQKVVEMLEALYLVLQKDLQLSYINPPPSFELPENLPGGGFTFSQKVFFPEQIFEHRRGTCLDLALLCAACLERMGLNPLCFLIKGHAFFGAWLEELTLKEPVLKDIDTVVKLVSEGSWLPLNSTTFAVTPPMDFEECRKAGYYFATNPETFMCAVDVTSARSLGIKPIPPLVSFGKRVETPAGSGGLQSN